METQSESSIRLLDVYLGQKIHVIAYGASYFGILRKVDYEAGILVMTDDTDTVTLDLSRVETFMSAEN